MPEVCEYIDPLVHDSREDAADVPTDHEGTFGLVVKRELPTLAPADSTGSPSMYIPTLGSVSTVEVTLSSMLFVLLELVTPRIVMLQTSYVVVEFVAGQFGAVTVGV